jgi:hypothetical protein
MQNNSEFGVTDRNLYTEQQILCMANFKGNTVRWGTFRCTVGTKPSIVTAVITAINMLSIFKHKINAMNYKSSNTQAIIECVRKVAVHVGYGTVLFRPV